MAETKNFLVSTADFLLFYNDELVCRGTTNLNTSIECTANTQAINAGKYNGKVYQYTTGKELNATLEATDFNMAYYAVLTGNDIAEKTDGVYAVGECDTAVAGIITLANMPIGKVYVELPNGTIVSKDVVSNTVDLSSHGITTESVKATYQYNKVNREIVVSADKDTKVYKLILNADKHNSDLGKVGNVEITVDKFKPSGSFSINLASEGNSSTSIEGSALKVEGECGAGSYYAKIKEFDDTDVATAVSDICATPAKMTVKTGETKTISVLGLKGGATLPVKLANADCSFASSETTKATVGLNTGIVEGIAEGTSIVTVTYGGVSDIIEVTVITA